MSAYYNEFDPYAAAWLRNLINMGHLPDGDIDARDLLTVLPEDIAGYTQCHFFAGIGGWPIALRLAGWPDEIPVWTGSCPCQPFSVAGKGKAQSDERHLWPAWFNLIKSVKPAILFGEQVAGAIARGWLDDAFDDLEGENYETAAAVLPACSVGAPHKRDRLWFVAHSIIDRSQGRSWQSTSPDSMENTNSGRLCRPRVCEKQPRRTEIIGTGETVSNSNFEGPQGWNSPSMSECAGEQPVGASNTSMANAAQQPEREPANTSDSFSISRQARKMPSRGSWWEFEPAVGRVANGIPARAHKLRAYGNAIVPQVAAEFIKAFMECRP